MFKLDFSRASSFLLKQVERHGGSEPHQAADTDRHVFTRLERLSNPDYEISRRQRLSLPCRKDSGLPENYKQRRFPREAEEAK